MVPENTSGRMHDPTFIEMSVDPVRARMEGYTAHGNMYFDVPFISNIEGNLWQGGCEDGLVLPEFIVNWVTLYPWEQYVINHELHHNDQIAMYDSLSQAFGQVDEIATLVNEYCEDGPTLVSCQAGLNRSGLVAARALMLRGIKAQDAIDLLREKRSPAALCNPAFVEWLLEQDDAT